MSSLFSIPRAPKLKIATSTLNDGNMSYRLGQVETVTNNRQKFLHSMSIDPSLCVAMEVEHDCHISLVDSSCQGRGLVNQNYLLADALLTTQTNLFLFLLTADCFPVVIYNQTTPTLALIHAGWQSADSGIIEKTLNTLAILGANPQNSLVWIGPGIDKSSYLVEHPKQKKSKKWQSFIKQSVGQTYQIDLKNFIASRLTRQGVLNQNIHFSDTDTATSDKYFSHYHSKHTNQPEARFATVAGLI